MRLPLGSLLVAASLIGLPAAAQRTGPDPDWVVQLGGARDATAPAVGIDAAYGVTAVAGRFSGPLSVGPFSTTAADPSSEGTDAFVVLLSLSGSPLWLRRIGGASPDDEAMGVAATAWYDYPTRTWTRAVYVAATFSGTATVEGGSRPDTLLTSRGLRDGVLVAYSATGDLLWVRQMGGPGDDRVRRLAPGRRWLPGGGDELRIAVGGSFSETASWVGSTAVSAGETDGFVADYRGDGLLRHLHTLGGPSDDDVWDVEYHSAIAVAGSFQDTMQVGSRTLRSRGMSDAYALLLPPTPGGTPERILQVGGQGRDVGRGVVGGGGGLNVLGEFEGEVTIGTDRLVSVGESDVFLATQYYEGFPYRGLRMGGPGNDRATDAARMTMWYGDAGQNIPIVAGVLSPTPTGRGGTDGLLFSEYASAVVGGPSDDRVEALGSRCYSSGDQCDEVATAGSFQQTARFGTHTLTSAGGDDAFVARYGRNAFSSYNTVAAEATPGAEARLRVGPNPSRGGAAVRLDLAASGSVTVDVLDALGRTVVRLHDGVLATGEARWTLPQSLPAGVYVVRVSGAVTARQTVTVAR